MCHNFFTHSSVNEHLGCFHVLAIVNTAVMNTGVCVSFSIMVSSGYMLEEEIATHSSTLAWKIPWMEEPGRLYSPWSREESDTTEQLHFHFSLSCIGEGNGNPLQCSCLRIPGMGEPGGLPSMGLHRVSHD